MAASLQEAMNALKQSPSARLASFIALPIWGLITGYWIGLSQKRVLDPERGDAARLGQDGAPAAAADAESDDDDDDDKESEQQELNGLKSTFEECKLVLVVRTDLGMTKGKIAAQCSHATLACYKNLLRAQPDIIKRWERLGQAKVAVQVRSEDELELLQAQAISLGICAKVIHDAGRTQIAAGSATVLGVGPAEKSRVDMVTGHLKLL